MHADGAYEIRTIFRAASSMTKILLVDDENLIIVSLSKTLRHDGCEVATAVNGKDALQAIERSPYDICFLDVRLPDANGLDLMKIVQERSPDTKVIIMTAEELSDGQLNELRTRACCFLPKPFDLGHVRSLVRRFSGSGGNTLTRPTAPAAPS